MIPLAGVPNAIPPAWEQELGVWVLSAAYLSGTGFHPPFSFVSVWSD